MDDNGPTPSEDGHDWLLPSPPSDVGDGSHPEELGSSPSRQRNRQWLTNGGLLAAGAAAGLVIVVAIGHDGSPSATGQFTPAAAVPGTAPNGQGTVPNGQGGPFGQPPSGVLPGEGDDDANGDRDGHFAGPGGGGLEGEQRLQGTLTKVGDSTITVKLSSGTSTYTITDSTQIVRNGAEVALSQLKVGDPVLVHVYPSGSGGHLFVERVFAGDLPAFPPGGQVGPGAPGAPDGAGGPGSDGAEPGGRTT